MNAPIEHEELRYGTLNREYINTWQTASQTEPMWALNLMHYREKADYRDGRDLDITGWEADNLYSPIGPLMSVGADIALVAIVADQPVGDDVRWDRVAIVKYPNRIALAVMDALPEFQELHVHKDAGMESTIVAATFPRAASIDLQALGRATQKSLLLLQFVASPEVPALDVAGTQPIATFDVEGVIIGDGRTWAEARWHVVTSDGPLEIPSTHDEQYVVVLKPQFGDFLRLLQDEVGD